MIKKILLIALFFTILSSLGVYSPAPVLAQSGQLQSDQFKFDLEVITHKDIKEKNWVRKGIDFVFERVITIMAATIGAAAVLMMAIGGLQMVTSAGDPDKFGKGKTRMIRAGMAVIFVLGAYIMVTLVQLLIKSIFTG